MTNALVDDFKLLDFLLLLHSSFKKRQLATMYKKYTKMLASPF